MAASLAGRHRARSRWLGKGLDRFDPETNLDEAEAANVPEEFYATWSRMNLDDCHGWPLWEKEMFLLLAKHYEELYSIFTFYAKYFHHALCSSCRSR